MGEFDYLAKDAPTKDYSYLSKEENSQNGGYVSSMINSHPLKTLFDSYLKEKINPASTTDRLRSMIYAVGKDGANVAKLFTGGDAPSMPDIRSQNKSPLLESATSYLPFGAAGGMGLVGSSAAAGTYGFSQADTSGMSKVEGVGARSKSATENMILNLLMHGLHESGSAPITTPDFKPKFQFGSQESQMTNVPFQKPSFLNEPQAPVSSEKIAAQIHQDVTGGNNFEDAGKDLASKISSTYSKIKGIASAKYDKIFNAETSELNHFTDEPMIVRDQRMKNSTYADNNHDAEIKDTNLRKLHEGFLESRSIDNAHKLQSAYGNEIGYLKKQNQKGILDDSGRNQLREYNDAQQLLRTDIRNKLGDIKPSLKNDYDEATENWNKNVMPYHSDKDLKSIAEGRTKNPEMNQVVGIFKNPEENINKVVEDLPRDAKDNIIHLGMGKDQFQNSTKDMLAGRTSLNQKGLSSYINPHHEQNFRNMQNNFKIEEEIKAQRIANQKIENELRAAYERSERARIAAAKERAANMSKVTSKTDKSASSSQKDMDKAHAEILKLQFQKSDARNAFVKRLIASGLGVAGVHTFGLKPEDMLGGYMGMLVNKGKK